MKIGLIDADFLNQSKSRFPNLALMKMSGAFKAAGHNVVFSDWDISAYNIVYVSKVFTKSACSPAIWNSEKVIYGGTGFYPDGGGPNLLSNIEHHMPDYDLYGDLGNSDYFTDFSIGFTTRGCFRGCGFCVNKNKKESVKWSPVSEFLDAERKYICLLDDNFLACRDWKLILNELKDTGKKFQFKQGLDIRLFSEDKAKEFADANYLKEYIFAFDSFLDESPVVKGLQTWRDSNNTSEGKVYLLAGYESRGKFDIISIFERIRIISAYSCLPYLMRYELVDGSEFEGLYTQLARWCNQPQFFKKTTFREFCELRQTEMKTDKKCSAKLSLERFEQKHPDVAKKYFDAKFWEERK